MPIYEYRCKECQEHHEIIQKFSDAPLTHCPKCGGEMKKLISSPAIQFKGSGFYKTDYAGTSAKSSSKSGESSESKSEGKSEKPSASEPSGSNKSSE
jgi:putative FmdB family regulatory protein